MSALAVHPVVPVQGAPRHGCKPRQRPAAGRRHLSVVNADYLAGMEAGRAGAARATRRGAAGERAAVSRAAARPVGAVSPGGASGQIGQARWAAGPRAGAARVAGSSAAARVAGASVRPAGAAVAAGGGLRQWLRETTEMFLVAGGICLAAGVIAFTLLGMVRP